MEESLLRSFVRRRLRGGFTIVRLELRKEPLIDPIGREAIAKTSIVGRQFEILIQIPLSDEELSVTLYHEVLEAATMATTQPPTLVLQFNEADFETAARRTYSQLGPVSPDNLDRMLQSFGFGEE